MKKRRPNLLLAGFLLGIAYWVLESMLHAYVFDGCSFREALVGGHDPNELWMRMIVTGLLTAFGWLSESFVRAERQEEEERAIKLSQLFNYIHEMASRIGDKFQKPQHHESHPKPAPIDGLLLEGGEIRNIAQAL